MPPHSELHHWHKGHTTVRGALSHTLTIVAVTSVFLGAFTGTLYYPHSALASETRPFIAEINEVAHQLIDNGTAFGTEYIHQVSAALLNIPIASDIDLSPRLQLAAAETASSFTSYIGSLWNQLFDTLPQIGATPEYVRTPSATEPAIVSSTTTPPRTVGTTAVAPVQQTIINQPVIERTIVQERSGLSQSSLTLQLASLKDELLSRIASINLLAPSLPAATFQAFAQSQRIDQLSGTALTNVTISGVSGLTDADIPNSITASNYLELAGGVLTGALTGTSLTLSGLLTAGSLAVSSISSSGAVEAPYFTATSTTASSTFPNLLSTNSTTTNATSTSLFSTLGRFTNGVFDTLLTAASATITNLTATTLTATNATTTRLDAIEYVAVGGSATTTIRGDGIASILPYASSTALTVSGSAYFATGGGNVGVGTTSPLSSLHVIDRGQAVAYTPTGASTEGLILSSGLSADSGSYAHLGLTIYGDADDYSFVHGIHNANSSTELALGANSTEAVRIDSSGNVGIGTTTPRWNLDVAGLNSDVQARFERTGAVTGIYDIGANANGLQFWTGGYDANVTADITFDENGNVGIGTTNPGEKLEVNGNIKFTTSSGTLRTVWTGTNGGAVQLQGHGATVDRFARIGIVDSVGTWTTGIHIQDNGNVGIGMTAPTYKLQLNGQPAANGYTAWTNYSDARLKENVVSFSEEADTLTNLMRLRPVTYNYNELSGYDEQTRARRISGFIAQELQTVFPSMVGTTTINGTEYLDTNLSDLSLHLLKAIQDIASLSTTFKNTLIAWLADAGNGIATIFAKRIVGDELCAKKSDGTLFCVSGDQLADAVSGLSTVLDSESASSGDTNTTTPPTITIAGENPATIQVGDTYSDLGVIATDSEGHELSYRTFINGVLSEDIVIDTSHEATNTIDFVATDTWGNTATSTRTVIVEAIAPTVTTIDADISASSTASSSEQ